MSYQDFTAEDRRLVLLRALRSSAQYRANSYLLRRYCDAVGHGVSADRLAQDLAWLAEQGLANVERAGDVTVAVLSARGLDVGHRRAPAQSRAAARAGDPDHASGGYRDGSGSGRLPRV